MKRGIMIIIATTIMTCALIIGTNNTQTKQSADTYITSITDPGGNGGGGS